MSDHAAMTLDHEKRISNLESQERVPSNETVRFRGSSTSTPSSPNEGDIWNDTTAGGNVIKIYANGGWRALN